MNSKFGVLCLIMKYKNLRINRILLSDLEDFWSLFIFLNGVKFNVRIRFIYRINRSLEVRGD